MIRNEFDNDYGWDGGNVVPWGSTQCEQYEKVKAAPDPVDALDFESLSINSLNKENLSEFENSEFGTSDYEALMLAENSNDGSSEDELDIDTSTYNSEVETPESETSDFEKLMRAGRSCDGGSEVESDIETSTCSSEDDSFFPFMDLPPEIRQQIYHWIHLMNPIKLTQYAPWYPMPVQRGYFVKAVRALPSDDNTLETLDEIPRSLATRTAPLLSPWRPYACIPTSILRVSKQIYYESRELPFRNNEFAFVNWYVSGMRAAYSFIKGLQPWQRQKMHYARLELLSRDLAGLYVDEWRELCGAWSEGLMGLRLKILSSGVGARGWVVACSPERGAPTAEVRDEEGKTEEWIKNGLKQLKQLRFLEVEISAADWDDNAKLDWCRSLEEALNESKTEADQHVRVCCVERARDL
ncbi:hypothetical protein F4805DRAFT_460342 [Annulohypoxylon moriforme]|nr:hypothetical protein F4805DRAFT_460342 [Annulohypoxylon moriforme]